MIPSFEISIALPFITSQLSLASISKHVANGDGENEATENVVQCEISPLLSYAGENLKKRAEGKVYTTQQLLIDVSGDQCLS